MEHFQLAEPGPRLSPLAPLAAVVVAAVVAAAGCGTGLQNLSGAATTVTQVSGNYSGTWSAIVSGSHLAETSFSMTLYQASGGNTFSGAWIATGDGVAAPFCGTVTGTSSADGATLTVSFTAPATQSIYTGPFTGTFSIAGLIVSGKVQGSGSGGKTLTSFFNLTADPSPMAAPFSGSWSGTQAGTINAVPIADTAFAVALYQSGSSANGVWVASGGAGAAPMCGAFAGTVSGTSLAATLIFAPNQAIYAGIATGTLGLSGTRLSGEVTGTGSIGGALDTTLNLAGN